MAIRSVTTPYRAGAAVGYSNIMSLARALAARLLIYRKKVREEMDVWRLYHFLAYRKQVSEGTNFADLKFPDQSASYRKQYRTVHAAVTQQVKYFYCVPCTLYS